MSKPSDRLHVDGVDLPWDSFNRKLTQLRRDVDAAWQQLDADQPGWHYWDYALSAYQRELGLLLRQRLTATILESYGNDLDEQDLPYILDHAIHLAWLIDAQIRARYLSEPPLPAGQLWLQIPSESHPDEV